MTPKEAAERDTLMRMAAENELKMASKTGAILKVLEQRKDQYYVVKVNLPRVEGNRKAGYYGDVYFRRWTSGEVEEIIGSPIYQKSCIIPEVGKPVQVTAEEARQLYELRCDFWARASPPGSGITKEGLAALGNWPVVEFVFSQIARRSGLDNGLIQDIEAFFRDPGR